MSMDRRAVWRSVTAAVVGLTMAASWAAPVAGQGSAEATVLLSDARSDHTATLLADDYVLLAGGSDGLAELSSVEIVDPVGLSVEPLGSLAVARASHTTTLLPDGRLLVAGGRAGGSSLDDAELLDPDSGLSEPVGPMNWARAEHDAALLPDGRVLLVGGLDGGKPVGRAELFDPVTETFEPTAKSKTAHLDPAVTVLPGGMVLVTGSPTGKKGASAEIYDPAKDEWSALKKAPRLTGHTSTLLQDGRVLLAGGTGAKSQLFDPSRAEFEAAGELSAPRADHTATRLAAGEVLILGGADRGWEPPEVERFDPESGAFETVGEMDLPRTGHTTTALSDGRALVAGGRFADLVLDDILVYEPETLVLEPLGDGLVSGSDLEGTASMADIRAEFGSPEAFVSYYYATTADDGVAAPASVQTWSYYSDGVEFTFQDGQLAAQDPVELEAGAGVLAAPYDPDQFSAGMSLEEVLAETGVEDYVSGPLDDLVAGGQLYLAEQLAWGMKDGELRYVEALALATDPERSEVE
jgi:hypothetical protein